MRERPRSRASSAQTRTRRTRRVNDLRRTRRRRERSRPRRRLERPARGRGPRGFARARRRARRGVRRGTAPRRTETPPASMTIAVVHHLGVVVQSVHRHPVARRRAASDVRRGPTFFFLRPLGGLFSVPGRVGFVRARLHDVAQEPRSDDVQQRRVALPRVHHPTVLRAAPIRARLADGFRAKRRAGRFERFARHRRDPDPPRLLRDEGERRRRRRRRRRVSTLVSSRGLGAAGGARARGAGLAGSGGAGRTASRWAKKSRRKSPTWSERGGTARGGPRGEERPRCRI